MNIKDVFKEKINFALLSASVSKETVANLRHRLSVMKEILGDEDDPKVSQVRKRNSRRKGCMDTILDGSFMGLVLVEK